MSKILKYIFAILLLANIYVLFNLKSEQQTFKNDVELYYYAINADKTKSFNTSLPEEKEITTLISQLTKLGSSYNLTIPAIHYTPMKDSGNGYKSLSFTLAVSGDYERIRQYIYKMETLRKFIYIESLTIRKGAGEDNSLTVDLSVSTLFK